MSASSLVRTDSSTVNSSVTSLNTLHTDTCDNHEDDVRFAYKACAQLGILHNENTILLPPGSGASWTYWCWPDCPVQFSLETFWSQVWRHLVKTTHWSSPLTKTNLLHSGGWRLKWDTLFINIRKLQQQLSILWDSAFKTHKCLISSNSARASICRFSHYSDYSREVFVYLKFKVNVCAVMCSLWHCCYFHTLWKLFCFAPSNHWHIMYPSDHLQQTQEL